MRYIVIDEPRNGSGDMYNNEFESKQDALNAANLYWSYKTEREKARRKMNVLDSLYPDPDDERHFDGDIIYVCE